jgi:outer membrane protein assembly factor BamB
MIRVLGSLPIGLAWLMAGADWHQWRGPNRDGKAFESRLPQAWPQEPPAPLWRAAVGEGYSSPVIANGRLYILGRQQDQEICYCFHADTGQEIWRHSYPQPFELHEAARAAGRGPKSTPVVDGDRVYMLGIHGKLHCLDTRSGRVIWHHDLAVEYWGVEKDVDGNDLWRPICGVAASPLIEGDLVIVPVGGKKAGALTAFHKLTGRMVWKALEDRSCYASPITAKLAGVRQLIGFTAQRLAGLDVASGKLLWDLPYTTEYGDTVVTPVASGNHVVVLCNGEQPATALRIDQADRKVHRTVVWQDKTLHSFMATPVAHEGHLYGLVDSGRLYCVEIATGKRMWVSGGSFGKYASFVLAGGQLLVLTTDGYLHVLEPTPKAFNRRARPRLSPGGETWSHLAVVGSRLYLKDATHVICYDLASR